MTSPWENPNPNSWKPEPTTPATGAEPPYTQPQFGQQPRQPEQPGRFAEPVDPWNQPSATQPSAAQPSPYPAYPATPTPAGYPVPTPYGSSYGALPDHPQAMTSRVLGILGLVLFPPLAPFAWSMASKARREIAQSPGRFNSSGTLTVGYVLGIIGTALLALAVAAFLLFILVIVAAAPY